jgi:hypothetical protein
MLVHPCRERGVFRGVAKRGPQRRRTGPPDCRLCLRAGGRCAVDRAIVTTWRAAHVGLLVGVVGLCSGSWPAG